jgi:hypothetical protein
VKPEIQSLEIENELLKASIEEAYRQIMPLDKILYRYMIAEQFTNAKMREQSMVERILPSVKV